MTTANKTFPFSLADLRYFIVRRKDGLTIKYNIVDPAIKVGDATGIVKVPGITTGANSYTNVYSLTKWCKHVPADEPLFETDRVALYIADCMGFRAHYREFTFALDCGDILTDWQVRNGGTPELFAGDKTLSNLLAPYVDQGKLIGEPRVLQIDWDDRKAPKLVPEFWPQIVDQLDGTVVIACQGGHGRSGTGAVCMMMVMNPEYTPADAIIHLRAIHCARAIESKEQHEYIGRVGEYLGRVNDIERIGAVNSFKEEFLALTHKSAKPYQDRLKIDLATGKVEAEDKGAEFD